MPQQKKGRPSLLAGKQGAGCVMYYGRPETNIEKLKQLNTDVIGFFGNLDKSITRKKVSEFENNMRAAQKTLTVTGMTQVMVLQIQVTRFLIEKQEMMRIKKRLIF